MHLAAPRLRQVVAATCQVAGLAAARPLQNATAMTNLPTITLDRLESVTGGIDATSLASTIGGLVDKFTGGKFGAQQKAGQLAGLIQSWIPQKGGTQTA
jgi:hypothetical protein